MATVTNMRAASKHRALIAFKIGVPTDDDVIIERVNDVIVVIVEGLVTS